MTGMRVGSWILGQELGRGMLGTVYEAQEAHGTRRAAVRMFDHPSLLTPDLISRFPAEMLKLQRLDHINIAQYYDSGVHSGIPYVAMEFITGTDLPTLVRTAKKSDEPGLNWKTSIVPIAVQACRALRHGHHRSLLHRGLHPSKLMLTPEGLLKIRDYGLSRIVTLPVMALTGDHLHTAAYLAPETFTGKSITRRSDIYSLGSILYFLTTGTPPLTASTINEYMHKSCYVLPDRPMNYAPRIPSELDELICQLLAKDPTRRPGNVVEILDALDALRGKAERRGEVVVWPAEQGNDLLGAFADVETDPSEWSSNSLPRPLLNRPVVVVPLFLLLVALMVTIVFWPRPTAEELYQAAVPLMNSNNPEDWDRARADYLDPLERRYPGEHAEEIKIWLAKIRDRKILYGSISEGSKAKYSTEEERLYKRGLGYARAGDFSAARRIWSHLTTPPDSRWVLLAQEGIAQLNVAEQEPVSRLTEASLREQLQQVQRFRDEGKPALAEALKTRLKNLYADDPQFRSMIEADE
jgi:serine/threonine protein kinase